MKTKPVEKKQVRNNILLSITAQVISLLVSIVLNLIVPKCINEYQYAYWQTYILYVGYVGIFHFGILDGIVLRYSQYNYEDIDKEIMRSQFKILLFISGFSSMLIMSFSKIVFETEYGIIAIMVSIGIVTKNIVTYNAYSFQITNRINKYVFMTITQRVVSGIIVIILLVLGVSQFQWFCIADILGDLLAITIGVINNKGMYFGKSLNVIESLKEAKNNISSGFLLLIATWASMLFIGGAKMIVQWRWDDLIFGKVSFAFSMSSLFLTFVNAASIVLFPTLKRMDTEKLPGKIRESISPFLFVLMLFYFPGCWLLEQWLPAYQQSLVYLGVLLPIIVFASKVSLLTNNYLKSYRKEKLMLLINVVSVCGAFILYIISAYFMNSLDFLLISVVLILMIRSIVSEIVVMRLINLEFWKDFIIEFLVTVVFVMCTKLCVWWMGFLIYGTIILGYLLIKFKTVVKRESE